jgi:hypothetical protein
MSRIFAVANREHRSCPRGACSTLKTRRLITFIELGLVVERTRYTWEAVIASRLGLHSRWLFTRHKNSHAQAHTQ